MKQTDPQYKLRIPETLKSALEDSAKEAKRSLNAEIVARLEASVFKQGPAIALVSAAKARELAASARKDIAGEVREQVLEGISFAISRGQSRTEVELQDLDLSELTGEELDEVLGPLLWELEEAGYKVTYDLGNFTISF